MAPAPPIAMLCQVFNSFMNKGNMETQATPVSPKAPTTFRKQLELLDMALGEEWSLTPDEKIEMLKIIARDFAKRDPQRFEAVLRAAFADAGGIDESESIESMWE